MRQRGAALLVLAGLLLAGLVLCSSPASSIGGTLDTSFGTGGATRLDFGGGSTDVVQDLAVQADGKVLAVGTTATGFAVARLNAAGVPDTTYGTGGRVVGTAMAPRGVALQSDGKALVVGTNGSGSLVLARFTTTGTLDGTFGTAGSVTATMTGTGAGARDVAVGSDGKVLALGVDGGSLTVLRYSSTGALDTSFGTAGRATTTATPGPADRLAVQSDGKVVLTGQSGTSGGLFRLTNVGAADTFGTAGAAVTATHVLRAVAVQSSGKLVAGGDFGSADPKALVVRRNADGSLDTTYGAGGVASFAVPNLAKASVRGLFSQADGSVVVTGRLNDTPRASAIFLARLTPTGALDTTFATNGIATFATIGNLATANANAVAADANGRYVVGGSIINDHGAFTADDDFLVLRITGTTTSTSTSSTAPQDAGAGATVTTDGGALPTPDNPIVVTLTTPVAGKVGIVKTKGTAPTGSRALGGATITAPNASVSSPIQLQFDIDVSTLPDSLPLQSIVVARDGTVAVDCTSATAATPDPCISSRARNGDTVSIDVLTTHASSWTLSRPILQRLFGDDRILSSIAISKASWSAGKASTVVLARSDDFADALAAIPLAVSKKGPLLLTGRQTLDDRVLAELTRVLPTDKIVYVLGGPNALSEDVVERVLRWGYDVVRLGGDTRYDTAVTIATEGLGSPTLAIETTGLSFADALAAGTAAASSGAAVVLTAGAQMPQVTADYVHTVATRIAIGGPAAKADKDAQAIVGDDRYETAVLTAKVFFDDVATIGVASGTTFADALSGGVHAGMLGAPLILLPPSGALPGVVTIYLRDLKATPSAYVYGGTKALGTDIAAALQAALGG